MTFAEFFHSYWWLMFPVFGMVLAFYSMISSESRARHTIDLIKSYVDQGKEPPAELLKLAARQEESGGNWDMSGMSYTRPQNSTAWTFVIFLALAVGFGAGYYFVRGEDFAFAFLIVAVTMGVLAIGALFILLFGRK